MSLTPIDKSALSYILFGLLSSIFIAELQYPSPLLLKWVGVIVIYLVVRCVAHPRAISYLIITSAVVGGVMAIGQQFGLVESRHSLFPITGFLGNPGQLGGFQAIAFVMVISLLRDTDINRLEKCALYCSVTLIGYSIIIADSRAGWIATLVGLGSIYYTSIKTILNRYKYLLVVVTIALIVIAITLFNYRKGSAEGRVLIWKVCGEMIADKPIFGYGVGTFNNHYMLAQAEYFKANPDSEFIMVADNAAYPYNEFLHIWIEQGILGIAIFLLLCFFAIKTARGYVRAGLLALLTFSLFSYPSYVYPLLVLYPSLFALASNTPITRYNGKWRCIIGAAVIFITALGVCREVEFYQKARHHITTLTKEMNSSSSQYFNDNDSHILAYSYLNSMAAMAMANNPTLSNSERINSIIPSAEHWCDIGRIYQSEGEYNKAIHYYKTASYMIPTRIMPNYLLWQLYISTDKIDDAQNIANTILTQKLKVDNTRTLKIKAEVNIWLRSFGTK